MTYASNDPNEIPFCYCTKKKKIKMSLKTYFSYQINNLRIYKAIVFNDNTAAHFQRTLYLSGVIPIESLFD